MIKRGPNFRSVAPNFAIAIGLAALLLIVAKAPRVGAQSQQAQGQQAAQQPLQNASDQALPSFEVASIKPGAPSVMTGGERIPIGMGATDPSHWAANNMTARDLVTEAYGVRTFQVVGGPAWVNSNRFDISAKVDDATAAQLQNLSRHDQNQRMDLMLRSLLIDRFKLQVTRETKDAPAYALVIAKGGPKLKETAGGESLGRMGVSNGVITDTSMGVLMSNFVAGLAFRLAKPVVDQTGLTGKYDITWHYTAQGGLSTDASSADTAGPTIFDALQDQFGLKLEATKAPMETVTIIHIEEPTPN